MQSQNLIQKDCSARDALILLDKITERYRQTLFVYDTANCIIGSVSDGDIRRGLIKGLDIDKPVEQFMNASFSRFYTNEEFDLKRLKKLRASNIRFIPILNPDNTLNKLINLHDLKSFLPVSALIMAGGLGTRLKPLTDKTPKPMLIVGDKPIIGHVVDRMILYGIDDIHISLRHLGEQIVDYLGDGSSRGVSIKYIKETEPKGTIGAASNIGAVKNEFIIVQNADLLCNIDYEGFYLFGKNNNFDSVMATFPFQVDIPYAVVNSRNDHSVDSISEKPAYTFHSNAGIYLFKTKILDLIPKDKKFDTPDLLEKLIDSTYKVGDYPFMDYWLDIGRHEDYIKAQQDIKHINLNV